MPDLRKERPALHTTAPVLVLPLCDLCMLEDKKGQAQYDGKTIHGPWAYMCEEHFKIYGVGLGLGRGQRLILRIKNESNQG